MKSRVTTQCGALSGAREDGLYVFRGVPYARPPVGELRFRVTRPPERWDGVREAVSFGAVSLQNESPGLEMVLPRGEQPMDEDCLYLNVWTPGLDDARRPVMVWIHGGAFVLGSGSGPLYDGAALARRGDVVVVTINYRLGALGALMLPEGANGDEPRTNFGVSDQIAALRWVRNNIAAFGGDADNVTIFGESAGGMSVGALLGSGAASGLFRRAIAQSGAGHNASTLQRAESVAHEMAAELGLREVDVRALRSLPAPDILQAQRAYSERRQGGLGSGRSGEAMPFQPVIDGDLLTRMPVDAVRDGAARDVSLLVGTTADEAKLFTALAPETAQISDADLGERMASLVGGNGADAAVRANRAIETYASARAVRGEGTTAAEIWGAVVTDIVFRAPAERLAIAQRPHCPATYSYVLDWKSPLLGGVLGACHAIDIPFVFGTHRRAAAFVGEGAAVDALAGTVMDAWIAFARSGDPATDVLGSWPAYDADRRAQMLLAGECRAIERYRDEELRVWDEVLR